MSRPLSVVIPLHMAPIDHQRETLGGLGPKKKCQKCPILETAQLSRKVSSRDEV